MPSIEAVSAFSAAPASCSESCTSASFCSLAAVSFILRASRRTAFMLPWPLSSCIRSSIISPRCTNAEIGTETAFMSKLIEPTPAAATSSPDMRRSTPLPGIGQIEPSAGEHEDFMGPRAGEHERSLGAHGWWA